MSDVISADVADILAQINAVDASRLPESSEFAALESASEVVAYMIHHARAEGLDETRYIEALVRTSDMRAAELREVERTLRPLGYTEVADMLKRVAKPAKRTRPNPKTVQGMGC